MNDVAKALAANPVIAAALVVGVVWFIYGRRLGDTVARAWESDANPARLLDPDRGLPEAFRLWTTSGVELTPEAEARAIELGLLQPETERSLWDRLVGRNE